MNLSTIEGARLSQPKLIMEIGIKIKKKKKYNLNLSTIGGARLSQPKLIMEIDIKIKKKIQSSKM